MPNYNAGTQMFYTRPSDGATYCFSPVPFLGHSKEFLRTGNGEQRLAIVNQYTFNGTLLPCIPALSGVDPDASTLQLLDRKSDQLCSALEDYGSLVVVDASGYTVLNIVPRVESVNFPESQIVATRDYSIVFEIESDFGNDRIRDFSEDWSFEQQEDDTTSVTHNISAIGVSDSGVGSALTNARNFVLSRVAGASPDSSQSVLIQTPFVQSIVAVDNLAAFNHVLSESSDIAAGSYNATETWILASGNYKDDRNVQHTFELDEENNLVETVDINGTIQGYGDTTFDKFTNAINAFNTVVKLQIGFDNPGLTSKNYTENRFAGTVAYSISRAPSGLNEQLENKSISRSFEFNEDGSVTQTVTTSAAVRAGATGTLTQAINFCFENNFPIDSAEPIFDAALSGNIVSISTQRDELAKSFSLTRSFTDQTTPLYREEFSVSREETVDSSQVSITVEGTVQGLGTEGSTKGNARFLSASGAYFGTVEPLIFARAVQLIPSGSCISSDPTSISLGLVPLVGTITYSQTFTSRFKTTNDSILDESIDINFNFPEDVVAEIQVPGKTDGPILQDQETVTGLKKSLSIRYTMRASTTGCGDKVASSTVALNEAITESNFLVNNTPSMHPRGEKPESAKVFKPRDEVSFNRQELVFQRNVEWIYI